MRSRPVSAVPSNVHVVESAPHGAVLPHVDLVITHGGHGTVTRSLAAGVPVMVVPISRDQPDNAARVVHHGVGIKVSKRSSPDKFATAVRRVLADGAIRANARRMAERLAPDVGAPKAIAALEELASPMAVGECERRANWTGRDVTVRGPDHRAGVAARSASSRTTKGNSTLFSLWMCRCVSASSSAIAEKHATYDAQPSAGGV